MSISNAEIESALAGNGPISRDDVIRWIDSAKDDLPTLAKLYDLTGDHYYRIQPELGRDAECGVILKYFLECIRQGIQDSEEIEGRWEAAQSLLGWFFHLLDLGNNSDILRLAAGSLKELFLTSDGEVQLAIEQGFLEHCLETAALRPYFEDWSTDARLRPAWERAMEWAQDHPDFMRGMFQRLHKIQEKSDG